MNDSLYLVLICSRLLCICWCICLPQVHLPASGIRSASFNQTCHPWMLCPCPLCPHGCDHFLQGTDDSVLQLVWIIFYTVFHTS